MWPYTRKLVNPRNNSRVFLKAIPHPPNCPFAPKRYFTRSFSPIRQQRTLSPKIMWIFKSSSDAYNDEMRKQARLYAKKGEQDDVRKRSPMCVAEPPSSLHHTPLCHLTHTLTPIGRPCVQKSSGMDKDPQKSCLCSNPLIFALNHSLPSSPNPF